MISFAYLVKISLCSKTLPFSVVTNSSSFSFYFYDTIMSQPSNFEREVLRKMSTPLQFPPGNFEEKRWRSRYSTRVEHFQDSGWKMIDWQRISKNEFSLTLTKQLDSIQTRKLRTPTKLGHHAKNLDDYEQSWHDRNFYAYVCFRA